MSTFIVKSMTDSEDNPFDRQQRIAWWSQENLKKAKVMVVGAGAIGNETLKNLALLGVGNIFIADFDTISVSNLSRTVLFRTSDAGCKKAELAAQRVKEMSLLSDVRVDWFNGDVVWELGTGIFREMDVVLGCLDNVETRFAVNRQCWLANTPWIDAGIYELAGHVSVYVPRQSACYQCNASKEQIVAARKRYSCDDFKKAVIHEGKMPTVQIASAIVSAIQVQEAVKLICGQPVSQGRKIIFQGTVNDFDNLELPVNQDCMAHMEYPEIIELPLKTDCRLDDFLKHVSSSEYSGKEATLDFRGDHTFVASVKCRACSTPIEMNRPSFRINETDTVCEACRLGRTVTTGISFDVETPKVTIGQFSLSETEQQLLNMTLYELGVPFAHVVAVHNGAGVYKYYELNGDKTVCMPEICGK